MFILWSKASSQKSLCYPAVWSALCGMPVSQLRFEARVVPTVPRQMNKQCTFDELPPERKKPKPPSSPTTNIASSSSHLLDSPSPGRLKRPRSPDDGSAALQALSYAAAQEKRLRTGESEPMSLDLSIGASLDPHTITTLLTGAYFDTR